MDTGETSWLIEVATLIIGALLFGYLSGAVPFGLIFTRLGGAGDIRQVGSGNIGATNVLRTGRKGLALATLLCDAAKGVAPVLVCRHYWGMEVAMVAAAGRFCWPPVPGVAELPGRQGRGHLYRRGDGASLAGRSFFLRRLALSRAAFPLFFGIGADRGGAHAGIPAVARLDPARRLCGSPLRAPDRTPSPEHPELDRRKRKQDIFSIQKQVIFLLLCRLRRRLLNQFVFIQ